MNSLAIELNEILKDSAAYGFLSPIGKRMYFPKGIVAQSDEAKEKAKRFNATVGLATSKGEPFYLSDIYSSFKDGIFRPSQIFSYAPGSSSFRQEDIDTDSHRRAYSCNKPYCRSFRISGFRGRMP